jgi:hypothetical protein
MVRGFRCPQSKKVPVNGHLIIKVTFLNKHLDVFYENCCVVVTLFPSVSTTQNKYAIIVFYEVIPDRRHVARLSYERVILKNTKSDFSQQATTGFSRKLLCGCHNILEHLQHNIHMPS